MGNVVLANAELSDTATIIGSSETTAGPANNLSSMQPRKLWQSTDLTPFVEVDFSVAETINLVALLFTNATSAATGRVRTAATQGDLTAAPIDDQAMTNAYIAGEKTHLLLWYPTGMTARWLRVDVSDPTNPNGFMLIGRLYADNALQLQTNYDFGSQDGFEDDSLISRTDGKQSIPAEGANRPIVDLTLNISSEAERFAIREINRKRGAIKDVLLLTDPDATQNLHSRIYYGLLQRRRATINNSFNWNKIQYQLTGLL
ncbi:MAG: hypothetical protein BMS9Abin09_1176 [Gammaproteobacteria bacterium]|nr:MAG: hypothetical protein BMS9Abin09_1176 [Gammaproteobacteria bacterium]